MRKKTNYWNMASQMTKSQTEINVSLFLDIKSTHQIFFGSAKLQLNETVQSFENIICTYNSGNITLQGRKLVANSLLLSKVFSFSTACNFSKDNFSNLQRMLDGFTHKKKISAGDRKYLPLRYGGLYIPDVYLKHLTSRMSLIKKLAFKLSNGITLPSWAEILVYVLKTFGLIL